MWPIVQTAHAMAPQGGSGDTASMLSGFLPLILVFAIFWFLVIRPQQKRAKDHRNLVANLKEGDQVVTDSGIIGTLRKVPGGSDVVTLEIAPKVSIRIQRARVAELVKEGRGGREVEESDESAGS